MSKSLLAAALILIIALVITGCGRSESDVVGTWSGISGNFQFFQDKTGVMTAAQKIQNIPSNFPFKWNLEGRNRVKIDLAIGGGKTVFGKFDGKKVLVIEDDRFVKQQ